MNKKVRLKLKKRVDANVRKAFVLNLIVTAIH